MSTLAIVLIVVGVVIALLLVLGFLGARARDRRQAGTWTQHVAEADSALEQARAADRGWDRAVMEAAAQRALGESRPGWVYGDLHLVLVDDRPGKEEDRAHFVAMGDSGDEARVILARDGDHWSAERVD
jgi:Flp pilus assembly protein TadB